VTRCIIHVGMHKTGSTSIQWSLDGFSDERFLYARLDIPNHSLAMVSLFSPHPEHHRLNRADRPDAAALAEYVADMRGRLERSVAEAGKRTLIVSGEDIGVLPPEGLARIRDWFRARFDELTVVSYVRPPAGFMASGFQQRVKSGVARQIRPDREYRNYRKFFGALDDVFGRENVHLWKFDPAAFPEGCAVRDFCSRLDIALPARRIVRLNESLTRQAVALLYNYGRIGSKLGFTAMRAPEGHKLGMLLAKAGGEKFRFSPDIVAPVLARNRADIEWMEARLGQSLDEHLGEHRPGDVRESKDLLTPDAEVARRLRSLLGRAAPEGIRGETPGEMAKLMHALRRKHASRGEILETSGPPRVQWRMTDLIDDLYQANPGLLDDLPEDKVIALIQHLFRHISKALGESRDGTVSYPGLGIFRIAQVSRMVDGRKVSHARITFHRIGGRAKPKSVTDD